MYDIQEISNGQKMIAFDGDLTIQNAQEIKCILARIIGESDNMLMSFEKVGNVDLAVLQLLCSAHRTATVQKKTLQYTGTLSNAYRLALEEAGYLLTVGCRLDCTQSCLWTLNQKN